jgi:uncharacterized membrane protein
MMSRPLVRAIPTSTLALTFTCALAIAPSQALAQSIRALGTPMNATGPVNVTGISGNGSVVFGTSGSDQAGFSWTAAAGGTWTMFSSPFHVGLLVGSTNNGSVIVGTDYHTTLSDSHAAHWGDNLFDEFVPVPNHSRSRATGVSADGSVIVGASMGFNNLFSAASRWTDPFTVDDLGGYDPTAGDTAAAMGVSADGAVAVGAIFINHVGSAVRWTAVGQAQFLDNTTNSSATKANQDGSVLAGTIFLTDHLEAFRWTAADGIVPLGVLRGTTDSEPSAISADGGTIVGNCLGDSPAPFLWTAGTGQVNLQSHLHIIGIDMTGWTLTDVTGISADGNVLVGNGVFNGDPQPWLATLTGTPPTCGSADFNHDGDTGTDADIEAFFACLSGNCCAACDSADFNGDGDTGTDADIEAFFRVLGGGPC